MTAPDVMAILRKHESAYGSDDYTWCVCGAETANLGGLRQHLADAITAAYAETEAGVRAEVLREAADRMPAFHDRDAPEWAITSACRWLRERADKSEATAVVLGLLADSETEAPRG